MHGDDFTFLGEDAACDWATTIMMEEYDIKLRGRLGPGKNDDKQITIPNICLERRKDELHYEPDPPHAEILIREMGVASSASVVNPGIKLSSVPEEDDPLLSPTEATTFRRIVARANFLSQDRMDIQYAVKEAARGMALPRQSHMDEVAKDRHISL